MKLSDLKDIQPILTVKEHEMLLKAEHIHEDPNVHTHPELQRRIARLMKMGLLRQNRTSEAITYERTEKGEELANGK
jgi:hypothetical protein